MTTLYDIGDKILITLDGKVIEYSASRNGDCYVIELSDPKQKGNRVYLSGEDLRGNSRKHYTGKAKIDFMDDMGTDRDKLSHDTEEQKDVAKSRSNSYLENLALIARETNMDTVTVPLYAYCEMLDRLKAQEPRMMTMEEIKALPDYVFLEDRDISHAFSIKTISRPALPQLIFVNTNNEECVGFKGPDGDTSLATSRYGVEWRCWTSRPTDEQRRNEPWQTK